jgi:hypothetical protein
MEVHFGWVLQGRAVQDTFIAPRHNAGLGDLALKRQTYGTTVRVFHPELAAWRAVWLNPLKGVRTDRPEEVGLLPRSRSGHSSGVRSCSVTMASPGGYTQTFICVVPPD